MSRRLLPSEHRSDRLYKLCGRDLCSDNSVGTVFDLRRLQPRPVLGLRGQRMRCLRFGNLPSKWRCRNMHGLLCWNILTVEFNDLH